GPKRGSSRHRRDRPGRPWPVEEARKPPPAGTPRPAYGITEPALRVHPVGEPRPPFSRRLLDDPTTEDQSPDRAPRLHNGAGRLRYLDGKARRAGRVRRGLSDRRRVFAGQRLSRPRLVDLV